MPVQQTHDLAFEETTVSKKYRSWDNGEPDREWAGLTVLAEHAPDLAPRPVRREVAVDGSPVVVMSRLPGAPLGSAPLTPVEVRGLGVALRRLYDVPVGVIEAAGLGERTFGPTVARASIRDWAAEEPDLGPCWDPALVTTALAAARDWLVRPAEGLDRVVDPVLALADGNIGNVVWDGNTCRLVDFEDCGLSDPAFEVADLVEHVSVRLPGLVTPAQLVTAVGLTPAQRDRCAAYRPLFAALWLLMLLPGNGGFPRNPAGSTEDQARHLLDLLGPRTS